MRIGTIIHIKYETTYFSMNGVPFMPKSPQEKLQASIFGRTKTEKIIIPVMKIQGKTYNQVETQYWNYIEQNNLDAQDYDLIYI